MSGSRRFSCGRNGSIAVGSSTDPVAGCWWTRAAPLTVETADADAVPGLEIIEAARAAAGYS